MWSCVSFLSLPVKERFRKVVSKGLCFRCLETGHRAEVCQKPLCKYGRGKHHSLLHLEPVKSQPEEARSKSSQSRSSSAAPLSLSSIVASSIAVNSRGKVILQTVPAVFCGSNGCKKVVRCFFDPGSHPDLVGILLRFRKNQLGLMGDIEKMFLKISLKEEDGDRIVTCGEIWTPMPHLRFIE